MGADVTELADVRASKARVLKGMCEFNSHRQHHPVLDSKSGDGIIPHPEPFQTHSESSRFFCGLRCVRTVPHMAGKSLIGNAVAGMPQQLPTTLSYSNREDA